MHETTRLIPIFCLSSLKGLNIVQLMMFVS